MQINSHLDPQLVDKIVHEVKSQGVFDEFRKNSMADVDTKPAYQNLRQRVETTVKRFLSEQKWSPEINKNQLRERLRKHITDSGFLDVGVERIVDQVVNPKIGTVFQPKIEDIAYKYLGVAKPLKMEVIPILQQLPAFPVNGNSLKIETLHLLPNDLEQVSPDSDKATVKSECKDECMSNALDIKTDEDDESPPFEPLEKSVSTTIKHEDDDGECTGHDDAKETVVQETSRNCLVNKMDIDSETQDTSSVSQKTYEPDSDKEANHNADVFQESHSQLSQVSSTSCLSTETRDNNNGSREFNTKSHENAVNISEEAQMPRFSENSNEENANRSEKNELHFDIKQDEIKFEGTKRNVNLQRADITSLTSDGTLKDDYIDEQIKITNPTTSTEIGIFQKKDTSSNDLSFKFTKIYVETKIDQPIKENSSSESLDDSGTAQLCIVDKSENTQISGIDFNPTYEQRSKDKDIEATEYQHVPPPPLSTLDCSFSEKREINECDREEGLTSLSLSSSRHKKHSKQKKSEKYRYRDKEREKEKEKQHHREKSGHRREKSPTSMARKSSTSSKNYHSSSKTLSSGNKSSDPYYRKSSSIPHHSAKHSSCSSRSKTRDEPKRNERDTPFDKRHQQASSSSSSSHKKNEKDKKSKNQNDDHYASKEKIHWRKSTDSNDEDKKPERISGKSNYNCSDSTKTTSGESGGKYKNENSTTTTPSSLNTAQCMNEDKTEVTACSDDPTSSKIVILNEILENPSTDFIELSVASQHNRMHVVRCEEKSKELEASEENSEFALFFFEQNTGQFIQRLKLIDNAIDRCRKVVNCLRFDSVSPNATDFSNNFCDLINTTGSYFIPTGTKRNSISETRATLHIDCIQYSKAPLTSIDFEEKVDNKRFKFMSNASNMVSPTLSDTSVNSKENEFIAADVSADNSSKCAKNPATLVEKMSSASNKLSQQRYTNDDLYKPRVFLGQRSRR